jgi:hypothetical protein
MDGELSPMILYVKVLGLRTPQRYAVKRTLTAAREVLQRQCPELKLVIEEIANLSEIRDYTPVTILPSLVVNEKLFYVGRFPKKDEVIAWLQEAMTG